MEISTTFNLSILFNKKTRMIHILFSLSLIYLFIIFIHFTFIIIYQIRAKKTMQNFATWRKYYINECFTTLTLSNCVLEIMNFQLLSLCDCKPMWMSLKIVIINIRRNLIIQFNQWKI